ncbi:DUF896 domain-containing protein [Pseudolactococcus plantarum]|uniref:UPF0291 protein RU87_GL001500 n=1 Tax=Pseudolactococcus plantarum TaxID=1365 RepID=A0A2A5RZG8_9LACT|nr:DUF896 domain-containing protein [Lactococcus plantarum]PCS06647.1 hypothetical protein RU87_GL001500 [Lactococcus plantarum]HCN75216.1 DUF896 domain-containing protein [Lactococcus sp.]
MVTPEDIARINELARKKKATGLTADETIEQAKLREAYITGVKSSLRHHVESIKVVDPEGNDITPEKAKKAQFDKGLRDTL